MKVSIITHAGFPEGLATTNRVFYHAKGLKDNNVDVKVHIAVPTEKIGKISNPDHKGIYKGIEYEYSCGSSIRSRYFFKRRYDDFIGPIKAAINSLRDSPDAVLLISYSSMYVLFIAKLVFWLTRTTLIVEETELPLFGKRNNGIYRIRNYVLKLFLFKNLDGFLVISYELINRYSRLLSKKCPIELIPVIVEVKDIYNKDVLRTRNIVYTGPLLQKKDGILTIIKSFSKIASDFPDSNLICTGSLDLSKDKENVKKEIEISGVKNRIILRGFISRVEMIDLLNSAVCLVLAKPSSDQADTCFPTKLGEYLATGNPIVVTNTGEIPIYLKDGESAYIAEPDSVESFTNKLRNLLSNPQEAFEIGMKGKEVAQKSFNYVETTKKVIDLIKKIKNKNRLKISDD